jgi:hypothetical protein
MMLCNIPVRREALQVWPAHDPSRERALSIGSPKEQPPRKLSGKTDRDRVMNFWKVKQRFLFPPKG